MVALNTSLVRLYAPYARSMKFVADDRSTAAAKRKQPTLLPPNKQRCEPVVLTFAERRRISLHEAAHVVAAKACGLLVCSATVGSGAAADSGVDTALGQVSYIKDGTAWEYAVIALAGPSADVVFYPGRRIEGKESDLAHAHQYAQEIDPQHSNKIIRQAWLTAVEIVRNNRTVVSCLAAILERNGKLSGTAIDGIIGGISFAGKVRPGPLQLSRDA